MSKPSSSSGPPQKQLWFSHVVLCQSPLLNPAELSKHQSSRAFGCLSRSLRSVHALLRHLTTLNRRLTLLEQVPPKVLPVSLAPQVVLKLALPVEPHVAEVARYRLIRLQAIDAYKLIRLQAIDAAHGLR